MLLESKSVMWIAVHHWADIFNKINRLVEEDKIDAASSYTRHRTFDISVLSYATNLKDINHNLPQFTAIYSCYQNTVMSNLLEFI